MSVMFLCFLSLPVVSIGFNSSCFPRISVLTLSDGEQSKDSVFAPGSPIRPQQTFIVIFHTA